MPELDMFEQMLRDSLQSDEQPSSGFAAAVMAQVARTPQRRPMPRAKVIRMVAGLAACVVIVCAATFPLWMRAGSSAPKAAGSAAPAEAPQMAESLAIDASEEGAVEEESAPEEAVQADTAAGGSSYGALTNDAARTESAKSAYDVLEKQDSGVSTYRVTDKALCGAARDWLESRGHKDDGGFVLHADEVEKLNEAVPGLSLPAGDCVLILAAS